MTTNTVRTVTAWLLANPNNPTRVIEKFGLTRKVTRQLSNGLVKAGYFLGESLAFELTEVKSEAQAFAQKYNEMAPHEQAFEFGLNRTFRSGDDFQGFMFGDGSRIEFNDDYEAKLTGKSVKWFDA